MTSNIVWDIANELRGEMGAPSPLDIVKRAREHRVEISPADLWPLASSRYGYSEHFGPPPFVSSFVSKLSADTSVRSILDVWAGLGATIIPLARDRKPERAIALERNREALETGKLLSEGLGIDWRLGNPDDALNGLEGSFDVVVGCGPFGMPPRSAEFQVGGRTIALRDDANHLIMLRAAQLLAPDGVGIFLTASGFAWRRGPQRVVDNLDRFGLHVDAVVALPPGSLAGTSIGSVLLIVRRQKRDRLFVAELSEATDCDILLGNLRNRREGRVLEYGLLTTLADFTSLESLRVQREIDKMADRLGYPPTPLQSLLIEVNLTKSKTADGFQDLPNSVYLPLIGVRDACTSITDLEIKAHNYAQLVLDPAQVEAEYIAGFFNTRLGRMIRESLQRGTTIPKLSKTSLAEATVYIPRDIREQRQVIEAEAGIAELLEQLNRYRRDLWEQPRRAPQITRAVEAMRPDDSLEDWLELLPYPLATILWTYHAESDVRQKGLHLEHFFEALAEFNVTLMLSAFSRDSQFFEEHREEWLDGSTEHREWYRRASFGNWIVIGARLAKSVRRMLSEAKDGSRDVCLKLFGNPALEFLDMLANKRLYDEVLSSVLRRRNDWRAHGGIQSDQQLRDTLRLLEAELLRLREIVSDWYTASQLIRPGYASYREGIYSYDAEFLMGRSYPFRHIHVQTSLPMESGSLHLLARDQLTPVQLLPFLRLAGSPSEVHHACYFYNRLDQKGARYVSYHFEQEPELHVSPEELGRVFGLLARDESK
jgi:SAM-dependent methyltransferase